MAPEGRFIGVHKDIQPPAWWPSEQFTLPIIAAMAYSTSMRGDNADDVAFWVSAEIRTSGKMPGNLRSDYASVMDKPTAALTSRRRPSLVPERSGTRVAGPAANPF
jgi:hypothetical protein